VLKGETIVCLSSIDWDFIWQGHQEIMSRLAAADNLVLFIENTGVRAPRVRDLPRIRHRLRNWWKGARGFRRERDNLFVYSPLAVPLPYSALVRALNRTLILRAVGRWARVMAVSRPVVWTFLPTPLALDLVRGLDPTVTVYYCIDSFIESSPGARRIEASEQAMLRRADLVFVTSARLQERALAHSRNVSLFPFGVDFETFDKVRRSPEPPPADLASLPRPLVGYVGGLHRWVDFELLRAVAQRLPQWSFVLVGPQQTDVSVLGDCRNVHRLGPKSHADVARYINAFDATVIPYLISEYTRNVYPTKLNEYLALGKPVVATALDEVMRFNARHGQMVAVARDAEEFARHLEEAVRDDGEARQAARVQVAEQNGWGARVEEMSALIAAQARRNRERREGRWRETLLAVYRRVQRKVAMTVAVVGGAYLLVFYTPLAWKLAEPLRVEAPPRAADAIVVLAGGVGESGRPGPGYQERVKHAVDLYRAGHAPVMVFSSGFVYTFSEPEVMKALAMALGVPASAIVLETHAKSTAQNVQRVAEILRVRRSRTLILVSSPYHMRRATMVFARQAPELEMIPVPVPDSEFYRRPRLGVKASQLRGILHEYAAIVHGWLRGEI
jgi:uncharacterized SAM-binding protein YcdF (DUF218 family)/glycosyltransferase involved in cell wall biosynthesis